MDFLLRYEVWLVAALILIAVDVVLGLDFILLSFGVGAGAVGGSLLLQDVVPLPYTQSWEALLTFFALFSLLILVPLRRAVNRRLDGVDDQDINRY